MADDTERKRIPDFAVDFSITNESNEPRRVAGVVAGELPHPDGGHATDRAKVVEVLAKAMWRNAVRRQGIEGAALWPVEAADRWREFARAALERLDELGLVELRNDEVLPAGVRLTPAERQAIADVLRGHAPKLDARALVALADFVATGG